MKLYEKYRSLIGLYVDSFDRRKGEFIYQSTTCLVVGTGEGMNEILVQWNNGFRPNDIQRLLVLLVIITEKEGHTNVSYLTTKFSIDDLLDGGFASILAGRRSQEPAYNQETPLYYVGETKARLNQGNKEVTISWKSTKATYSHAQFLFFIIRMEEGGFL